MVRRSNAIRRDQAPQSHAVRSQVGRSQVIIRRIHELLESTPARLAGLELVDVELVREGRRTVVRVLVDRDAPGVEPGHGGGITIEDCSRVSRMLGDYLDGDSEVAPLMDILGAYALEVSSPGIDRPLKKPEHFMRFRGQTAAVTTVEKILGRNHHLGRIAEVTLDDVVLDQADMGRTQIQFTEIKQAHLKNDPWQVAREAMARSATGRGGSSRNDPFETGGVADGKDEDSGTDAGLPRSGDAPVRHALVGQLPVGDTWVGDTSLGDSSIADSSIGDSAIGGIHTKQTRGSRHRGSNTRRGHRGGTEA